MKNKIETKRIEDVLPDPNNVNKHTLRGHTVVENSIRRRGVGRGILAAGKNTDKPVIMAGNLTHEKARDAGIEEVLFVHTTGNQLVVTVRDDLDPTSPEAIALGIEDNESGKLSYSPDIDLLAAMSAGDNGVLSKLKEDDKIFGGMLEGMGIKEESKDTEPQVDRAAELLEKWQVKTGDLWQIGNHRLICGDCTDSAVVARVTEKEPIRLVIIDPPYGVSYADKNIFLNAISPANRIETPIENDHMSKEDTQTLWKMAFAEIYKAMDKGAVIYCFMPQGGDQMMMMMMMMMSENIEPRHELIWLKNNHVLGRVDYAYKHEPILYAWKEGGHKFYGEFQTSILEYPKPQLSDLHPTMKPVELIEKLISNSSLLNEIVMDSFLGSGTTLLACENLGRRGRAIEISPAYCAVTLERMSQAFPGIEIKRLE